MSLKIIKAGLLDTIQDLGRHGYQHQGINPGGAMDKFSVAIANSLMGKEVTSPVIEMHFPAAEILFQQSTIACLTGADFSPTINHKTLPLNQPFIVYKNSTLKFLKQQAGARTYLAILQTMQLDKWLNSYSTNSKAEAGGYKGRRLLKNDIINFNKDEWIRSDNKDFALLPWQYHVQQNDANEIKFIPGKEWDWLSVKSQTAFLNNEYVITPASDRMGFTLQGDVLEKASSEELISSPVNFGTIQLLPNGQLIVLMADHQTTGGYPRIGHVISSDLSKLVQKNPGEKLKFGMTNIRIAEQRLLAQQQNWHTVQVAANYNLLAYKAKHPNTERSY